MADKTEELKIKYGSDLTSLKTTKNEKVEKYFDRAESLNQKCAELGKKFETYEFKHYLASDLNLKALTANEIREILRREEDRNGEEHEKQKSKTSEYAMKAKERNYKNKPKCYKCGKFGLISRECYGETKCYNCNNFGHYAKDCEKPKSESKEHHRGRGRGNFRGRGRGHSSGKQETSMMAEEVEMAMVAEEIKIAMKRKENNQ
uniref:CCHC-type domain-containing protein n=1 Tax=Strigamia maritima TaxID=126957 RepID=T1IWG6_STRMM